MTAPTSTDLVTVEPPTNVNTEPTAATITTQPNHLDSGDMVISPPSPSHFLPSGDRDPSSPSLLPFSFSTDPVLMIAPDMPTDPELGCQIPDDRSTPTPVAASAQPLLSTAGKGTLKHDGACEDFVDDAIIAYWEAIPGGGKWAEMIKSYLTLTQRPPAKGVS